MFHFPAFPPTSLYIQLAVTHHEDEPGFPIRKSSDQRPVIGSPRLIADSHVLHRLLMPRHPPCALNNLHTIKKNKNLKSTIKPTQSQFNANSRRCSRPLYSSQTTTHNTTTTQKITSCIITMPGKNRNNTHVLPQNPTMRFTQPKTNIPPMSKTTHPTLAGSMAN